MPSRHATPPCPTPDGQRRERPPPRALTEETPADGVHDAIRCDRPGASEESSCICADRRTSLQKTCIRPRPRRTRPRTDGIRSCSTMSVITRWRRCGRRRARPRPPAADQSTEATTSLRSRLHCGARREDPTLPVAQARSRASVSPHGRRPAVRGTEPSPQDDARTSQAGSPYLSVDSSGRKVTWGIVITGSHLSARWSRWLPVMRGSCEQDRGQGCSPERTTVERTSPVVDCGDSCERAAHQHPRRCRIRFPDGGPGGTG